MAKEGIDSANGCDEVGMSDAKNIGSASTCTGIYMVRAIPSSSTGEHRQIFVFSNFPQFRNVGDMNGAK